MQNGACVANICTPNSSQACSITNGAGVQTCNAQGSAFGSCNVANCNTGFTQSGNTCIDTTAPSLVVTETPPVTTTSKTGRFEFTASDSGSGLQAVTCQLDGEAVENCSSPKTYTDLSVGEHNWTVTATDNAGNTATSTHRWTVLLCSPQSVNSCRLSNGTGQKTCSANGLSFGSCRLITCDSGFHVNGGSCRANICTPNSTNNSCRVANGSGFQRCNSTGSGFVANTCQARSCDEGFSLLSGRCSAARVEFFDKPNFKKLVHSLPLRGQVADIKRSKRFDSLRIPPGSGLAVRMYDKENFVGRCYTITQTVSSNISLPPERLDDYDSVKVIAASEANNDPSCPVIGTQSSSSGSSSGSTGSFGAGSRRGDPGLTHHH